MDKKIKKAFGELEMSQACAEKIQSSFRKRDRTSAWIRCAAVAAACLALAMLILTSPSVVKALENVVVNWVQPEKATVPTEPVEIEDPVYRDENFEYGYATDKEGNQSNVGMLQTGTASWLLVTEDGVYFTGNGEHMEIGTLMSTEVPFTYVYEASGILHYIAVGYYNNAEGQMCVGWHEWLREADKADGGRFEGWFGGGGTIPDDGSEPWGWLEAAKDQFDVPWGRN